MLKNIRNFCIVAHVDHGKTTLADRIIEFCAGGTSTFKNNCVLDTMEIERRRGITIKAQCVTLYYKLKEIVYTLNMLDTPGHADFFYEVTHALSACDGVVLLVDVTQGIEAQTVANYNLVKSGNITILPVLNKVDVVIVDLEDKITEVQTLGAFKRSDILLVSAKKGLGIEKLLFNIVHNIRAPITYDSDSLICLIIDSWYDHYFGVTVLINIKAGCVKKQDSIFIMGANVFCKVEAIGIFVPEKVFKKQLMGGDVGFIVLGLKNSTVIKVGDTITHRDLKLRAHEPLPGFRLLNPVVFSEIYPLMSSDYITLKKAIEKLCLNDSFTYKSTKTDILGLGFSCGYFGMLHMEIVKERLKNEFNVCVVSTNVNVVYEIRLQHTDETIYVNHPEQLQNKHKIVEIREPICITLIMTTKDYVGNVVTLCAEKRGRQINIEYTGFNDVVLHYKIPLQEIVLGFGNCLKAVSQGYASFSYYVDNYERVQVVRVDVVINNSVVNGLSTFVHKSMLNKYSVVLLEKIIHTIQKHQFDIKVQIIANGTVVLKKVIKAVRKNVLDKCYGGDRTRKDKLLQKQKLGKKKLVKHGVIRLSRESLVSMFI